MPGYPVSVAPGKSSTQLGGAPLAKGATIANQDSTNGIWVSSSSSVSPGNGQFIGPLGNGQWINDNAIAYACVDTGVTSAVSIVVSGDVSGVSNPVALAAATATLLLTKGVTTVFQGSLIENITLPAATFIHTVPGDLSQYASVAVNLQAIGPQQGITFTWLTAPGGNIVIQRKYLATGLVTNNGSDLKIRMPVEAPTLRIDFGWGSWSGGTLLLVYGSTLPAVPSLGNLDFSIDSLLNQAWMANTIYSMGTFTTNGGWHSMRMLTVGTGTAYFGYRSVDSNGNLQPIYLFKTAAGQDAYGSFILPRGCLQLIALTNIVATYQAEFSITSSMG